MKRAISNPNRVHHTMYILIIAISVVALIISITLPNFSCKLLEVTLEVLKNLSYGCIASTLVAWIIDYALLRTEKGVIPSGIIILRGAFIIGMPNGNAKEAPATNSGLHPSSIMALILLI